MHWLLNVAWTVCKREIGQEYMAVFVWVPVLVSSRLTSAEQGGPHKTIQTNTSSSNRWHILQGLVTCGLTLSFASQSKSGNSIILRPNIIPAHTELMKVSARLCKLVAKAS